jgi:hypothetical protein
LEHAELVPEPGGAKVKRAAGLVVLLLIAALGRASASGPLGLYAIVEKVVFEPNETAPECVQLWGAFAFVDGISSSSGTTSPAKAGYLYFRLPDVIPGYRERTYVDNVRREWADLKSVAGTGQAVGFGRWGYISSFSDLRPDLDPTKPARILYGVPTGGAANNLRVRAPGESPADPAVYQTNIGVVRLTEQGSHAAVVKQLKDALARR